MGTDTDSVVGLSTSDQNGSTDDLSRNQSQSGPETRFGVGCGFGRGFR